MQKELAALACEGPVQTSKEQIFEQHPPGRQREHPPRPCNVHLHPTFKLLNPEVVSHESTLHQQHAPPLSYTDRKNTDDSSNHNASKIIVATILIIAIP